MPYKNIQGGRDAGGLKFAVVVSRFNEFITERLLGGALEALENNGCRAEDVDIVKVPGAWELPVTVRALVRRGGYDAIIALGAVVRGQTPHFDYIAGGAADGLGGFDLPVAFGVLTTDTLEQAMDRAGGKSGNKGSDAALAAIEMANLLRRLREA